MTKTSDIFYNAFGILTFKRLYNLIMGVRGHGKTDNTTKRCIECGLEQKKISFVVLVRYKEDIRNIKDCWWEVCSNRCFPEWQFFSKNRIIYAKNELEMFPIGEIVALNEYVRAKKVPRPYVKYIVFDEFLNEDNDYLSDEVGKFLSICDSIIRLRDDVRVFLISNTISMLNPYFDYFGFNKIPTSRFTKGLHDSVLEFTDSEDFQKFRANTKFGSSVQGTDYGAFALQGKFMLDDTTNVYPNVNGKYNYLFNIVLNNLNISVYLVNNLMYLTSCKDYTRLMYTPYVEDAKNNNAIYCHKGFKYFKTLNKYFMNDEIMYESLKIKNEVIQFIKYLMGTSYQSKR